MKFKLNFEELESLGELIDETSGNMEDFEDSFSKLMEYVKSESSSTAMEKLESLSDEAIPQLKEIIKMLDDQKKIVYKYVDGHRDINEDTSTFYRLDSDAASKRFNKTINVAEEANGIDKLSRDMDHFIDKYEKKMRDYYDVDDYINLDEEYEDKEDVKYYIMRRRNEIDQQIANFKYNRDRALDNVEVELRRFANSMENHSEIFHDFKKIVDDIVDFEETFNPGFWDKHGGQIKTILTIASMFAGTPLSFVVAGLELAVAIGEGQGIVGAALDFIPGEKILGAVGDAAKAFDGKVGKSIFGEVDELSTGCFKCSVI